jgi:hypothetical protein
LSRESPGFRLPGSRAVIMKECRRGTTRRLVSPQRKCFIDNLAEGAAGAARFCPQLGTGILPRAGGRSGREHGIAVPTRGGSFHRPWLGSVPCLNKETLMLARACDLTFLGTLLGDIALERIKLYSSWRERFVTPLPFRYLVRGDPDDVLVALQLKNRAPSRSGTTNKARSDGKSSGSVSDR